MALKTHSFQQITSLSASTALTVPTNTRKAWIQCESQAVRYRADGTAPTAGVGLRMQTTDPPIEVEGDLLNDIRFIQESASAKLNVIYFVDV